MLKTYAEYLKDLGYGNAVANEAEATLAEQLSDYLIDRTLTQSQFSTTYTSWLTSVFSDSSVKAWLQSKGINTSGTMKVEIAQNGPELPSVSFNGVTVSQAILDQLFANKDVVELINGKTFQERSYVTGFEATLFQTLYAPKQSSAGTANVSEDGPSTIISALQNVTDADSTLANLTILVNTGTLPPGVSYNSATKTFSIDPTHSSFQSLNATDSVQVEINYQISDGQFTSSAKAVFTINGTNDDAIFGGQLSGSTDESNDPAVISGTASVSDVDNVDTFQAATVTGTNGDLVIDADGHWTFTANDAFDGLNEGDKVEESFTVLAADGTETEIKVTINGTNDKAVITAGNDTGTVTEDTAPNTATGNLANTDIDNANDEWQSANISGGGHYGTLVMNEAGEWVYNLDNTNASVNALNVGGTLTDSFTVKTKDGQDKVVQITIQGKNDLAVIAAGNDSGSVTEDAVQPTVFGNLANTDVDNANDLWQAVNISGGGHYGTLVMNAAGEWTFTLDNTNTAVNNLNNGSTLTDTFTVATADGQNKVITITINGNTDVDTITTFDYDDKDVNGNTLVTTANYQSATNSAELIIATPSADTVDALNGGDTIYGRAGDDTILGGGNNDIIYAGSGNDKITGGAGVDTMYGGSGNDTFVFNVVGDSNSNPTNSDTIADFHHGYDKIDLAAVYSGTLNFAGIATANSVWITESGGNTLVNVDTNGSPGNAETVIKLTGTGLGLTASDFVL
jgi:VCBS repeat-containing protein